MSRREKLFQQLVQTRKPDEACLLEMMIACENVSHSAVSHDEKTTGIYQRPCFVEIFLKKGSCFFVRRLIDMHYLYRQMVFDRVNGGVLSKLSQ